MTVKLVICGSRDFADYPRLCTFMDNQVLRALRPDFILSGSARGADALGERFARDRRIPLQLFPADWDRHGRSAGYIRNEEMIGAATHLVAFWDGQSRGTHHAINFAHRRGIPVYLDTCGDRR